MRLGMDMLPEPRNPAEGSWRRRSRILRPSTHRIRASLSNLDDPAGAILRGIKGAEKPPQDTSLRGSPGMPGGPPETGTTGLRRARKPD